jgi:hypothetical protein
MMKALRKYQQCNDINESNDLGLLDLNVLRILERLKIEKGYC